MAKQTSRRAGTTLGAKDSRGICALTNFGGNPRTFAFLLAFWPKSLILVQEAMTLKQQKSWSRKKIVDEFSGMLKADGTPMSRQQIHMLRKKAKGICLTCGKPAVGVYCPEHTIQARERMRKVLHSKRRHWNSPSYHLAESAKSKTKGRLVRFRPPEDHAKAA